MRTALTIAAFAAGAFAVPYKRDVITNYDVVYVTDVVTVTAGQLPTQVVSKFHYGHGGNSHSTTVIEQVSTEAKSTYQAPPPSSTPEPSTSTSVYIAPKPSTTEAPSSTYVAPTTSSAPAYTSSAAASAAPTSYQDICVEHHNIHRRNHTVPDVEWSDDLASTAQQIAESCKYAHNTEVGGGGYGQNIAAGVEATNISAIITDLFYNGEEPYFAPNYGMDDPDMTEFEKWGHFTQIVWKDTTHVGCYTQYCPGGLENVGTGVSPYFTVCNYKGPGNYAGEYGANVLKPKGESTANWNSGLSK